MPSAKSRQKKQKREEEEKKAAAAQTSSAPSPAAKFKDNQQKQARFLRFLHICFVLVPNSYTIDVSYDRMLQHDDVDLRVDACISQKSQHDWLLPAAREFLRAKGFGTEVGRTKETCLLFSKSFPERIHRLKDFVKYDDLVQHVKVFRQGEYVQVPTARGRLLFVTFMDLISENHSKKVSFNGAFNLEDILIINHKQCASEIMEIVKATVKAEDTNQAMVIDLHRAAEIFIPLYKDNNGVLPVYFDRLKKDLEGATKELVAKKWFRRYLRYHVAIMPSAGRRSFEISLYSSASMCVCHGPSLDLGDILEKDIKPLCLAEWKSRVNPESGKTKDVSISALKSVYLHRFANGGGGEAKHPYGSVSGKRDSYGDTLIDFIRFRRNFLEHGGQHENIFSDIQELELCLAKEFSGFLPNLLHAMLQRGEMQLFGQAWPSFKPTRWAKS
ncbi:uncharacterized protein LOC119294471 [Triticum dicoccoides]|uniref:uncharacterized protein LOC119294471 n=1 Tax=Triticum dicoccoides TaxID=85692 RepID=UPI000E79FD9F|nr:uncharacterized protein LOC119294471 [Triticum dicoccoides]